MGGLLYAKNMIVTIYHESDDQISFPYLADEKDPAPPREFRRPSGHGFSGFILMSRRPQRIDQARYHVLVEQGDLHSTLGSVDFNSLIGAPMIYQDRLLGVIILQSYDSSIGYDDDDLGVLTFVAEHIAAALVRKQTDDSLREKNSQLQLTLVDLQLAQDELVRKEKLASLGALVAGVAHEINTPIGVAITAASHLEDEVRKMSKLRLSNRLTATDLDKFGTMASEGSAMVLRNLRRADELIRNFKQVAVDQSSDQKRRFELKSYIDEVLLSLQPKFRHTAYRVEVNCPDDIVLDTYPAAIYQILINLVMNSLIHGFENRDTGLIRISVSQRNGWITIQYEDDGCGMQEETRARIFDPFFTTRRGHGGTGLGMHIVFNLVTQALNGRIEVISSPGAGSKTIICFPTKPLV